MTLPNLLRIGKLKAHVATALEIKRLLAAVERNLADAAVAQVSVTGDTVTPDMVAECAAQAGRLVVLLKKHLKQKHPSLLRA